MSKRSNIVGVQLKDTENFDDYRNHILDEQDKDTNTLFRRKLSQGAFWTSLDKDLANQYFRDEKWFFGWKYKDEIKLIDHGTAVESKNGIGFINKNK